MVETIRNHHDLKVWQVGMELAVEVYRVTSLLPHEERFGLVSQARRAAVGVPANIAEGAGRESTADFARFISIARGSLSELETHLLLCERLQLLTELEEVHLKVRTLRKMLSALRQALLSRNERKRN